MKNKKKRNQIQIFLFSLYNHLLAEKKHFKFFGQNDKFLFSYCLQYNISKFYENWGQKNHVTIPDLT